MATIQKKYNLQDYSAFAIAFLAMQPLDGKVVYTDIEPDIVLDHDFQVAYVDMDNNGVSDFWFWNVSYYTSYSIGTNYIEKLWAGAVGTSANEIAGVTYFTGIMLYLPYALADGELINSDLSFQNWLYQRMAWRITSVFKHTWAGGTLILQHEGGYWYPELEDHYLGVHFVDENDKYHYGWIRCSVLDTGRTLIIKDYAYERFVDSAIIAGDLVGVLPNVTFDTSFFHTAIEEAGALLTNCSIYSFNKTVFINTELHSPTAMCNIYSAVGQKVYSTILQKATTSILLSTPAGIYFVEVLINGDRKIVKIILE